MFRFKVRRHKLTIALVGAAIACTMLVPSMASAGDGYNYSPSDPNDLQFCGSTTVYPISANSEAPFRAWRASQGQTVDQFLYEGTGSSAGIKALLGTDTQYHPPADGTPKCDIANSSRNLSSSEIATGKLVDWRIAKDAVCVIVKDSSSMGFLNTISMAQLNYIYSRGSAITTTTWNDVDMVDGSDDWQNDSALVVPRARDENSGTRVTFLEIIGVSTSAEINTINATGLSRLLGNQDMVDAIAANNNQIGYVGVGFIDQPGIRVIPVGGITPSETTILNGTYPLSRDLHMITLKSQYLPAPKPLIQYYINWIYTCNGQAIVADEGFIKTYSAFDVQPDGQVNVGDLVVTAGSANFGQTSPANPRCDVNGDGQVNVGDLILVSQNFRAACS